MPITAEVYTTYLNVSFLEDETKYVATPKDRIITILIMFMLLFIMELIQESYPLYSHIVANN